MNGKYEEKLARLAFGDMSPEEAAEFERRAESDPQARKCLTEYRALRADLRNLGEHVPPDQLSKERLRDAILGQGLRPVAEPEATSRGWMWMPVAACAVMFAYFGFLRPSPTSKTPSVVIDPAAVSSVAMKDSETLTMPKLNLPTAKAVVVKKAAPVTTPIVAERTSRREHRAGDLMVASTPGDLESDGDTGPILVGITSSRHAGRDARRAPSQPPPKPVETVAKSSEHDSTSGPIVLIDSYKDADTGTNNATEVGTASNVLVGG